MSSTIDEQISAMASKKGQSKELPTPLRPVPRVLGHKRTKSAGYCPKDIYQRTGLYGQLGDSTGLDLNVRTSRQRFSTSEVNVSSLNFERILLNCSSSRIVQQDKQLLTSKLGKVALYPEFEYKKEHGTGVELSVTRDEESDSDLDVDMDEETSTNCGLFSFRPSCLQKMATIQVFVFLSCVLVTLNQALSSGYFNSVITTIEKRFDIPSKMTGMIASTFELGNMPTVIFVSYFGTHRHIPTWIGKGVLITGVGSLLFAVPHFLDTNNPLDSVNISGPLDDNICHIPQPALNSPFVDRASHYLSPPNLIKNEIDGHPPRTCVESGSYRSPHVVFFVLAMVLIGCGGTPIFTLGTIYIDDHVKQESSSMYIGCMYSTVAFGLVVGFLLGGYLITVHENSYGSGIVPPDLYPGHPKWIGAWWAGFILLGILLILVSIPFFMFPKKLRIRKKDRKVRVCAEPSNREVGDTSKMIVKLEQTTTDTYSFEPNHERIQKTEIVEKTSSSAVSKEPEKSEFSHSKNPEYGRSLGDIPRSMWSLLSNPVYIVTCLGSCMELSIVSGFLVFLPKYLETQFTISKSEANLFAGGIAVPGACVGIFLGGYLLKRFQLGIKGAIQFVLFFNLVCMGLYTALYFLGCDNMKMAGTTHPYYNSSLLEPTSARSSHFQVNLTAECNMGCRCSPNDLEPICGQNGITYFSPCHAGCQVAGGPRHTQNYSNCACIADNYGHSDVSTITVPIATAGPCSQKCKAMIPFLIILFVVTLVVSITQMPLLMVTLRSVREEERAFALGMQFVIFRLFGYIPSPIVFGNVIDSTCLLWKINCAKQGGFCLIYDIERFRLRYVGVCSALKVAAALLFFLDWILVCWQDNKTKKFSKPVGMSQASDLVSSIISLDKLSVIGFGRRSVEHLELLEPSGSSSRTDSDYNSVYSEYSDEHSDELEHKRKAAGPGYRC